MIYQTDESTIDQAIDVGKTSLLDVCRQYGAEHQAYWYLVDSGKYSSRDDYRAKHHWRRVKALQKRIKEQGQAEGVDGYAFYSANFGD